MIFELDTKESLPSVLNPLKCQPVAVEKGFLFTVQDSSLMLWTERYQGVFDTKHCSAITALCISSASLPYICSCSNDKVIIWNFDDFSTSVEKNISSVHSGGHVVGIDLGVIRDCSINCCNSWLALCRINDVWIVSLQHLNGVLAAVSHHALLEPAGEQLSVCCFSPNNPDLLVTADGSNVFKVWNVEETQMVQRFAVGAWHHISFCDFVIHGSQRGHLLVGTSNGSLHQFSIDLVKPPKHIGHVSAAPPVHNATILTPQAKEDKMKKSSLQSYLDDGIELQDSLPVTDGPDAGSEAGCIVLSALVVDAEPSVEVFQNGEEGEGEGYGDAVVEAILAPAPLLMVCSNRGVAVYDCNSWSCLAFQQFNELLDQALSLVSAAALAGRSPGQIQFLLSGWTSTPSGSRRGPGPGATTILARLACRPCPEPLQSRISFLSLTTPSARSPLRAHLSKPGVDSASAVYGSKSSGTASRISLGTSSRPVRSSGYGAIQVRQRFVPVTNRPAAIGCAQGRAKGAKGTKGLGLVSRLDGDAEVMRTWVPPLRQSGKVSLWHDQGAAVRLAASGDGLSLACSCGPGPGVLSVLRWAKPNEEDCVRITGHDARVTSICFSADSSWLMSASSDGRTKVWDWQGRRCVLDMDAVKADLAGVAVRRHSVAQASFFYLDRFILRAVSNAIELHCHRLHDLADSKAECRSAASRSRRVRTIKFPTQQVTCFTAPNNFYSNVLVAGCASRSLHVYDVDAERFLAEVADAHPRPPHALVRASSSSSSNEARAADLICSAAICDGVKLWDLRQGGRCVRKFTRHLNRAHTCGISLSPCCRFLAVGSEDKCVYVYDTRNSSDYVDKLMGLNDVVLDVAWNSNKPQLAASALNSCVAVYSSRD